jgi:hypothetical protein
MRQTPLTETIIIEGDATNVVLGAEGDHFVVPGWTGRVPIRSPGRQRSARPNAGKNIPPSAIRVQAPVALVRPSKNRFSNPGPAGVLH